MTFITTPLEEALREVAKRLTQEAIEYGVDKSYIFFREIKYEKNHRLVTKNRLLQERDILTGIGPIHVRQSIVRNKRAGL